MYFLDANAIGWTTSDNTYGMSYNWIGNAVLSVASGGAYAISNDAYLIREAANNLTFKNPLALTTAQKVGIYNTWTDASNYERLTIAAVAAGAYTITSEAAGTGTVRNIALMGGNVGIGTTAPTGKLDVQAGLQLYAQRWLRTATGGTPVQVAAIDTNGIGQLTTIRGSDTVKAGTASGATYSYFIPGGALVQSSDESLKANILPCTANLANFKLVTPRTYNFKKEVFLETFDRKSVPDSVDVKIDSVTTIRVSNLAAKDSIATAFYVNNLAYAESKSKVAYRGFLANEFNPLLLGKESKEINQQDVINVLWLKVQELEKRIAVLEKR